MSRAELPDTPKPACRAILVWDAPVRVFHWLMVACFAGAWLTAESERWRLAHVTLGYTMGGLVVFRLFWGIAGTRHARFANFVRGPGAVVRYIDALLHGRPEHHTGHNPAGGWAIIALLALTLVITVTGWAVFNDTGGRWTEKAHEFSANLMLALTGLHIAAVVFSSWVHGENLIGAMFSGRKQGLPKDAVSRAWRGVALLMMAVVFGYWAMQWRGG